jgi:hypothetical protein
LLLGACAPEPEPPVDPWVAAEGCYTLVDAWDVYFTGEKNVLGNAKYLTSSDGSCSGAPVEGAMGTNTFVEAADRASASALCDELDPGPTVYFAARISWLFTPEFPIPEMWSCVA